MKGSVNVLTQAEKAGIKNFAYTSSIIAHSDGFLRLETDKVGEDGE